MKRQAETRNPTDELPSFLDESSTPATETELAVDTETGAEPAVATTEAEPTSPPADPSANADGPAAPTTLTRHHSNSPKPTTAGRGTFTIAAGCTILLGALGLGISAAPGATAGLERFGATPATLVLLATVLVAGGTTRRRLAAVHGSLHDSGSRGHAGNDALQEGIQFLVAAQHAATEKAPAAGEELQHVLVTLQRQDEKINNLTKAIKMYGKPLMEISGQGTELAAGIAQVRTATETAGESTRQAFTRIEGQLRSGATWKQDLAELHESVRKVAAAVAAGGQQVAMPSLEPLQQQLARIDVGVQALAQRLEDSEVQKSLVRLEDAAQKAHGEFQQLLRGESVEKATTQLQKHLDGATKRLSDGINQMRDGNLGGIEATVREIQREVSGVATAVAQIQATVKQSGGKFAAAPTPAPTAPATPTTNTSVASPTAAPAPTVAPTPAAAPTVATTETKEATGSYQTGTRTTASKNVLGAIAKLKQMKT